MISYLGKQLFYTDFNIIPVSRFLVFLLNVIFILIISRGDVEKNKTSYSMRTYW